MNNYYLGKDFRWFIGTIEDIQDPLQFGRFKVRIHGVHSEDKVLIPTENLPWAQVLQPATQAFFNSDGVLSPGLKVGSSVVGFFLDGSNCQLPMILGSFLGVTATNIDNASVSAAQSRASGKDSNSLFTEPHSFSPQYPYNKIKNSAAQLEEVDDTPGSERILNQHKSGTFEEMQPDGSMVTKVMGSDYEITIHDKNIHTKGNENKLTDGTETEKIGGNLEITVSGDADIKVGSFEISISGGIATCKGKLQFNVSGDANISVTGDATVSSSGSTTLSSTGPLTIKGTPVTIHGAINTQSW